MPRLNVTDLRPQPKYRKKRYAGKAKIKYDRDWAIQEDSKRVGSLRVIERRYKADVYMLGRRGADKRAKRTRKLRKGLDHGGTPPQTPASAVYHFDKREALLDHLTRLIHNAPGINVFVAALLPAENRIPAAQLHTEDPKLWIKRLRNDLDRAGGTLTKGWLVAGLHGEYDPQRDQYGMHYHVAFTGGMLALINKLRGQGKYQIANLYDHTTQAVPILVKPLDLNKLRYGLSYVFQSWWPRREWWTSPTGKFVRGPRKRIPEPQHTDWLHWADQRKFQDQVLLYHLEVRRSGLCVNSPRIVSANRSWT